MLDKVTVRLLLQALRKLGESQLPTDNEWEAVRFFSFGIEAHYQFFISPATVSVLQRIGGIPRYSQLTQLALQQTHTALPGRYYKRWARRLREFGFTREDAAILALATFGVDPERAQLGMEVVVTFDQPMINH